MEVFIKNLHIVAVKKPVSTTYTFPMDPHDPKDQPNLFHIPANKYHFPFPTI